MFQKAPYEFGWEAGTAFRWRKGSELREPADKVVPRTSDSSERRTIACWSDGCQWEPPASVADEKQDEDLVLHFEQTPDGNSICVYRKNCYRVLRVGQNHVTQVSERWFPDTTVGAYALLNKLAEALAEGKTTADVIALRNKLLEDAGVGHLGKAKYKPRVGGKAKSKAKSKPQRSSPKATGKRQRVALLDEGSCRKPRITDTSGKALVTRSFIVGGDLPPMTMGEDIELLAGCETLGGLDIS